MQPDFWLARWQQGKTGFHRADVNPWLKKHVKDLLPDAGAQVFVPLCGKSVDLAWLAARGFQVTGNELSPLAVDAIFGGRSVTRTPVAPALVCVGDDTGLRILQGDFFAIDTAVLGPVDACWDRAALIALPSDMRQRYAQHLANLLPEGARLLLVTLEYPPQEMSGPPFSVSAAEVAALFDGLFTLQSLSHKNVLAGEPRFREQGVTRLDEHGWLLTRTGAR